MDEIAQKLSGLVDTYIEFLESEYSKSVVVACLMMPEHPQAVAIYRKFMRNIDKKYGK